MSVDGCRRTFSIVDGYSEIGEPPYAGSLRWACLSASRSIRGWFVHFVQARSFGLSNDSPEIVRS